MRKLLIITIIILGSQSVWAQKDWKDWVIPNTWRNTDYKELPKQSLEFNGSIQSIILNNRADHHMIASGVQLRYERRIFKFIQGHISYGRFNFDDANLTDRRLSTREERPPFDLGILQLGLSVELYRNDFFVLSVGMIRRTSRLSGSRSWTGTTDSDGNYVPITQTFGRLSRNDRLYYLRNEFALGKDFGLSIQFDHSRSTDRWSEVYGIQSGLFYKF
ncbi:MAG: hypothetical protein LAT68_13725 [Cyclobacteriaceae bacterium]|nr:hypothetical protein [Cyclobacteriaceae bacterium]MCH8517379.1 hypothetical protein [Cyclobacteriaceae bacterium]